MATEIPDVAHAFLAYRVKKLSEFIATGPDFQRPFGVIMSQAGIEEVIELQPVAPNDPQDLPTGFIIRLTEQLTDEEGAVELAVFPFLFGDQDVPLYLADGFESIPIVANARIVRAYSLFTNPQDVGPVAPAFVADNPNEWVVAVLVTLLEPEEGAFSFVADWSIAVQKVEVAGNKVGGLGSQAEVSVPFIQPPT